MAPNAVAPPTNPVNGKSSPASSPSTELSLESLSLNTLSLEEVQKRSIEFWLRPENYCCVPMRMAVWLFSQSLIPFRHCLYALQKDTDVPEDFEDLCKFALAKYYSDKVNEKPEDKKWFQYLSELQYGDESAEMEKQNSVHKEMKKKYEEVLTQMEKITGGELRVVKSLIKKRVLMAKDPAKGVNMSDHQEWRKWLEYSDSAKDAWNDCFERNLYQKGEFCPKFAKEKAFKAKFNGGKQRVKNIYKNI